MFKTSIYCLIILFYSQVIAQNDFEIELDSISTELEATNYLKNNTSKKGKLIIFNREKHNTTLADGLFNLSIGGKKVYKTDLENTYYKVIEKTKIPYFRISYIYLDGSKTSKEEIHDLRQKIFSKYNEGIPFNELARLYSMDSNAKRGGDLGWFTHGDTGTEFENAVINSANSVGDIFTVDITEKQWYYVVLKTHDTKMIEEIKVLKLTEPHK